MHFCSLFLRSSKAFIVPLKIKMEQRRFTSEMEWAPFKCLFWNVNDSVLKVMVSVTSGVLQAFLLNYVKLYGNDNKCQKRTTI